MADFDTALHNAGLRIHTDEWSDRFLVKHENKPTNLGVTPEVARGGSVAGRVPCSSVPGTQGV